VIAVYQLWRLPDQTSHLFLVGTLDDLSEAAVAFERGVIAAWRAVDFPVTVDDLAALVLPKGGVIDDDGELLYLIDFPGRRVDG
jgi:hypothetical protein